MIKGYIIKKIGEDVYWGIKEFEDDTWGWGHFPFIFDEYSDAHIWVLNHDAEEKLYEVKRADIFITP